jgi:hypothetical protein
MVIMVKVVIVKMLMIKGVMVKVVMVKVVMVKVVMVKVVMVKVVMVMVVEMAIEKRGLIECIQYEKFASFSNLILYMVTLTYYFHNTSLITKVHGR